MSAFAFLSKMTIHEAGHVGDALTNAVVGFDPVTASEVDIANQEKHCHDLALRMAEAEQAETHDHQVMDGIGKTLADTKTAARMIGAQLQEAQTAGNTTLVATLNTKLTTLMDTITTIGGDEGDGSVSGTYFTAVQNHARSEQKMHEWQQTHAGAMANLTAARTNLQKARTALQDAHDQEVRANEERAQALRDAGLKNGTSQNVALDAMTKMAEEAQKRARAAIIDTESAKASMGTDVNDIVKETLAQATTPVSALDRLAKLK